ncbi:putative Ig domain-containing protein [Prosthecobacter sp.]
MVHYPSLGFVFYSYYDADGDGIHNQDDSDPTNMDRDNDGTYNWNDGYPDDPFNGNGDPYSGEGGDPPPSDSDNDGISDSLDPFPSGSYWYENVEYGGNWTDADGDGTPDPADPTPSGSYWYNDVEYAAPYVDQDGDTVPDPADPWPTIHGSYWYAEAQYPGNWADQDGDEIPDPADPFPSLPGSYMWEGTQYGGSMPDMDNDGIPDFADPSPQGVYDYGGNQYHGPWLDSDGDTVPNPADPFPYGSHMYNGVEYGGPWIDSDDDGLPDGADAYPNGSYIYLGVEYAGVWSDPDNDGIPDAFDPFPALTGGYSYGGVDYGGPWVDNDSDGIPNPADSMPDGSFWYNGTEYIGLWVDSDSDTIPDFLDTFPNGSHWWNGVEYAGLWSDRDSDDVPDDFDLWPDDKWNGSPHFEYNGVEYAGNAEDDRDGDTIPDAADSWPDDPENDADNDGDGLSNYAERTQFFTSPDEVDSDHDFLSDYEEVYVFHTDPVRPISYPNNGQKKLDGYVFLGPDSDQDGLPNRIETYWGLDPGSPFDAAGDNDGDGYTNLQAFHLGWSIIANINPTYDVDGDRIPDAVEDAWDAIEPGILNKWKFEDAVEDAEGDGIMNFEEIRFGLDIRTAHSQATPVDDFQEWIWRRVLAQTLPCPSASQSWYALSDADHNGVADGLDAFVAALAANPTIVSVPTRLAVGDYDNDGMPDTWEYRHGFDLYDPTDAPRNEDGDLLNNLEEFQKGRDPFFAEDPALQIITSTLPDAVQGLPYSALVVAAGGQAPYNNMVVSYNCLPDNLSLEASTGVISGSPTYEGTWRFRVTVADQRGVSVERELEIRVNPPPVDVEGGNNNNGNNNNTGVPPVVATLEIATTESNLAGVINVPFTATIHASGGNASSYSFMTIAMDPLPDGLEISADGRTISGTPTTIGASRVYIFVTDGVSTAAQELLLCVSTPTFASFAVSGGTGNGSPPTTSTGGGTSTGTGGTTGGGTTTGGGSSAGSNATLIQPYLVFYPRQRSATAVASGYTSLNTSGRSTVHTTRTYVYSVDQTVKSTYSNSPDSGSSEESNKSVHTVVQERSNPVATHPFTAPVEDRTVADEINQTRKGQGTGKRHGVLISESESTLQVSGSLLNGPVTATYEWSRYDKSATPNRTSGRNTFPSRGEQQWPGLTDIEAVITRTVEAAHEKVTSIQDKQLQFEGGRREWHYETTIETTLGGSVSPEQVASALPAALAKAQWAPSNVLGSAFDYSPENLCAYAYDTEYYAKLQWPAGKENAPNRDMSAKTFEWDEKYSSTDGGNTQTIRRRARLSPGEGSEVFMLSAHSVNGSKSGKMWIGPPTVSPVSFEDEEPWSGLDEVSPTKWLMVPQDGENRVYIIGEPGLELKMVPQGLTYVTTETTTTGSSREFVTIKGNGGALGDGGGLAVLKGTTYAPDPLLNFAVKRKRQISVAIHPITLNKPDGAPLLVPKRVPDEAVLQDYLNKTFGDQSNIFCTVDVKQGVGVNWDAGVGVAGSTYGFMDKHFQILNPGLGFSDEEMAVIGVSHDAEAHVNVYFIAAEPVSGDNGGMWTTNISGSSNSPCLGFAGKASAANKGVLYVWDFPPGDYQPSHQWAIAHEMGHYIGGLMHSTIDLNWNVSHLPGTDNELRLMSGAEGPKRKKNPRMLIKKEWDKLHDYFYR